MAPADAAQPPAGPPSTAFEEALKAFVGHCVAREPASLRLADHQVDFLPGEGALCVTFEPAATGKSVTDFDRPAWSQAFLQRQGHAVLGVKRGATDWYRSPDLHRVFRALQDAAWFRGFAQVIFYGPSMGGYAALAFAACAPGCTVLALNPQSTLAPERVWFDQRFAGRRAAAWQGDFVDGAAGAAAAGKVYVCYDPYQTRDRLHVDRLPAHNLVRLRLPFVGHTTAQALKALGLLTRVFKGALDGSLDERSFRDLARQRVQLAEYHCRLAERGVWQPRRLRHLARALAIEPQHARAGLLTRVLTSPPAAEPASEGRVSVPDTPVTRWPTGLVTAPRVPLVYLNLPKCASTTIQNHLLYIARSRYSKRPEHIQQHLGLSRTGKADDEAQALITRQLELGALVFTFVRHPGERAYACFMEKIVLEGRYSLGPVRALLQSDWGLRLPGPGEAASLAQHRENFSCFLRFVQANLAGDTPVRREPHWSPQGPMLVHYRKFLKIDVVGKVENFAADMALVLHKAGVQRIPDTNFRPWRHGDASYSFAEVVTPEIQAQLDHLYGADYKHLGYAPRKA